MVCFVFSVFIYGGVLCDVMKVVEYVVCLIQCSYTSPLYALLHGIYYIILFCIN